MKIPSMDMIQSEDEARQLAIGWQAWQSERSFSYAEMAAMQDNFEILAKKFNLTDEFRENGII